jgi:hypothetical protein
MNRRDFCKTIITALIAWGLNPVLVLADNGNKILNGEFFIDLKFASNISLISNQPNTKVIQK